MENANEREFVVTEATPIEGIKTGTYKGFEEVEIKNKKTNKVEKVLRHYFAVKTDEKEINISCLTDMHVRKNARFGRMFKAFVGRDALPGERFSPSKYIGKQVTLVLETDPNGYARILNILPLQTPQPTAQPTTPTI